MLGTCEIVQNCTFRRSAEMGKGGVGGGGGRINVCIILGGRGVRKFTNPYVK
jgi:hypothetical protein